MKLIEIQLGQAIRFVPLAGLQGTLYGPNLARAFEDRYGFIQGPRTVEEWDMTKGVSFHHGIFEKSVIVKFTIFPDGLVCETKVNSAIADRFLDDAMGWARESAGFAIPASTASRAYLSRVSVQMDVALDRAVTGFSEFGRDLALTLTSYGRHQNPPDYGVAAVHFHVDNSARASSGPPPFMFERLANQPYGTGDYFSSGPLATDDHLRLLETLERALAER